MNATIKSDFLRHYGTGMVANGWPIVPILPDKKFPGLPNWQQVEATEADVEKWVANGHAHGGIGILTATLPVIDVDVPVKAIADTLLAEMRKVDGLTDYLKIGAKPKFSVMTRLPDGMPPFTKMKSAVYLTGRTRLNDKGKEVPEEMAIEVLCSGQQTVCYHVHPNTGEPYQWPIKNLLGQTPDVLPVFDPAIPEQLFDLFESTCEMLDYVRKGDRMVGGDEAVVKKNLMDMSAEEIRRKQKTPFGLTPDQLRKALPENEDLDYDQWLRVICAIHFECQGWDDGGVALALEWSEASDKHDEDGFYRSWNYIKDDPFKKDVITMASFINEKEAELRPEIAELMREREQEKKLDREELQRERLERMLQRYALVAEDKTVVDLYAPPDYRKAMKLDHFKAQMVNVPYYVERTMANGSVKVERKNIADVWQLSEQRVTFIGETYLPSSKERIIRVKYKDEFDGGMKEMYYMNSFSFPLFEETEEEGLLELFFDHMEYLMPIESEREWFFNWMAFSIQQPERRCPVTPLHISTPQGTGRGWLVRVITALVGKWNHRKATIAEMAKENSNFNGFLNRSIMCFVDEAKESGKRYSINDKIRDILTDETLKVNVKYGTDDTQDVYTNFFMTSNHHDALILEETDRRMMVISGPKYTRDGAHYVKINKWLRDNNEGVRQLFWWLMRRDIANFDVQRAPNTPARRRMISVSTSPLETLLDDLMGTLAHVEFITLPAIKSALVKLSGMTPMELELDDRQTEKQLLAILRKYGWQVKMMKDGKQKNRRDIWCISEKFEVGFDDTKEGKTYIRENLVH